KCLLEGFGVSASYGRLREACQTDVDGTSIDTLEEIVKELGLEAEQVMIPPDHVFLDEADALPAIAVVRLPSGSTHFVVIWRRLGGLVQVMDPGRGRHWTSEAALLAELFVHTMPVPAEAFLEWAASDEFGAVMRRRLRDLGCAGEVGPALAAATAEGEILPIAALDAAALAGDADAIPAPYWTARPAPPDAEGAPQVMLRGAVLVRVSGRRAGAGAPRAAELAAALREPPSRPMSEVLRLLRRGGALAPGLLAAALAALLLRGALDLGRDLGVFRQRFGAVGALCVFLSILLLLEIPIGVEARRIGRHLEARLRLAFLQKLPRLGDRYLQSRTTSDMAERSHALHAVRALPELAAQIARSAGSLLITTLGIAWLDPTSALVAAPAAALA